MTEPCYVGRFAPSPTGPLHFGSLIAAVGSFLDARRQGGHWAVRIEDVDRPRTVAGAAADILRTLDAFALHWDGPVVYQSQRDDAYRAALERLIRSGLAFPCACTRREIRAAGRQVRAGVVYPGTCRAGLPPSRSARSWRCLSRGQRVEFDDRQRGIQHVDVEHDIGDFVIRRADGLFAYHLAMTVDDGALEVTDVVRGGDLLDCVAPQAVVQRALGLPRPRYLHLPVAVGAQGRKLSKQTQAPPVDRRHPSDTLHAVLAFLGQAPPRELAGAPAQEILAWGQSAWDVSRVPNAAELAAPDAVR